MMAPEGNNPGEETPTEGLVDIGVPADLPNPLPPPPSPHIVPDDGAKAWEEHSEADSADDKRTSLGGTASLSSGSDYSGSDNGARIKTAETAVPASTGGVRGGLSSLSLGLSQIRAILIKNLLGKYRTPIPTFFELFSPVLMMLILVAAYSLSEVRNRDAKTYSNVELEVPGPWLDLIERGLEFSNEDFDLSGILNVLDVEDGEDRELRKENNKQRKTFFDLMGELGLDEVVGTSAPSLKNGNRPDGKRRMQAVGGDDLDDEVLDDISGGDVFDLFNDARGQLNNILKSPIVIPTFDQYVTLSSTLSSLIDPGQFNDIITDSTYGREWGNLLTLGTLHVTPNGALANEFVGYLKGRYPSRVTDDLKIRIHDNEDDALDFINDNLGERTWALVDLGGGWVRTSNETDPWEGLRFSKNGGDDFDLDDFGYKIRMNYTTLPNTNEITNYVSIGLNKGYQRYYLSGYLTLQRTLNEFAFYRLDQRKDFPEEIEDTCEAVRDGTHTVWSMPMPTAAYSQNAFFTAVGYLLGLTIAMAYLYPVSRLIKSIVEEKETKMKETLFILGVRPWAHWISWSLTSVLVFLFIDILVSWTLSSNVLMHSSPTYLFMFIFLFSTATIGFSFFIAAFFSRAKLAAIVGPVALFATLLPRWIFFGTNRYEATAGKMWASLLPCTTFAFGADIIADYEYAEQGVQSYNASEGEYSFNTALGFLFFDTFLYFLLGWYFENVIPRQYGVAKKWYFVFMPSYWFGFCCSGRSGSKRNDQYVSGVETDLSTDESTSAQSTNIEPVTDPTLIPQVQIQNLHKRYTKKPDVPPAVDNLSLQMYESQITCLLGHNGAGKSTTISVLTGLFPPTSGDCTIYGHSIIDNLAEARHSMGICPQHNVLFDKLTVAEHLRFFERIKGRSTTKSYVTERAREVGLGEYVGTTSSALSGGNKRKLSVAIALCGDPQFLLLDEPTSGMDPYSRRATWELLRRKKEGRVTLLTTHFMDEAELLADRIAVMKEGKLQCCGSGLFLKRKFSLGYNLTIVMSQGGEQVVARIGNEDDVEAAGNTIHRTDTPDADAILTFLQKHIPETILVRKSARECMYRFPQGAENSFPSLFDALEIERDALGVGAYGISNTTLEEVFLQLAEREEEEEDGQLVTSSNAPMAGGGGSAHARVATSISSSNVMNKALQPTLAASTSTETNTTIGTPTHHEVLTTEYNLKYMSPLSQIALLLQKRYLIQKRDLKGACFMIILPVALIGLVLLILMLDVVLAGPGIEMNMDLYDKSPSGSNAQTDVLVGGGAQYGNPKPNEFGYNKVLEEYKELKMNLHPQYSHAQFDRVTNAVSSDEMSRYLLQTLNDHSHNGRYGAFTFDDQIRVTLDVDWKDIKKFLREVDDMMDGESLRTIASNMDWFSEEGWDLKGKVTVEEVAEWVFEETGLGYDSVFNVTLLKERTSSALDKLIDSVNKTDTATPKWIERIQNTTDNFATSISDSIDTNDTDNINITEITTLVADYVEDMYEIVTGLNYTDITTALEELFGEDDIEDIEDLFNRTIATETMEDLLTGLRDAAGLDEDDFNVTAITEDVMDGLDSASKFVRQMYEEITGEEYTTLETAFEVMLGLIDENYNRTEVEDALDELITVVTDALGLDEDEDETVNVTEVVNAIGEVVESVGNLDGTNVTGVSNDLIVAALVAVDTFVERIMDDIPDETFTMREAFQLLSDLSGGTENQIDGYWQGSLSVSFDFDIPSATLSFQLRNKKETVLEFDERTYTMKEAIDFLISYLPSGQASYNITFDSPMSILHNASSPHAVGAFNQAYMEYLYKRCTSNTNAKLTSINHPLPLTTQQSVEIRTILSIFASLFILIPYCYVPAAFIVFLVKERMTKSKHLQLVSGVNMSSYWISTYLWDIFLYLILTLLIMAVFLVYGTESAQVFVGTTEAFFTTMALTFGYGLSSLPFAYLLSRMFENHSTAQISVMGIFFITGFVAVNAYFIMSTIENTKNIAEALRPLFRMWPAYNVGDGFIQMSDSFFRREILYEDTHPLDWDVCGKPLCLLYTLSLPYFTLLLILEYSNDGGSGGYVGRILRSLRGIWDQLILRWNGVRKSPEGVLLLEGDGLDEVGYGSTTQGGEGGDADVEQEKEYVTANQEELKSTASVLLVDLWKIYPPSTGIFGSLIRSLKYVLCCCCRMCRSSRGREDEEEDDGLENKSNLPKRAVRGLTTAITEGETYGLLGVNGAGKTTTLGVLTGDITPTSGTAHVAGFDVTGVTPGGVAQARKQIGFCPQVDPLLDLMTGRETLSMFAKLRGIPKEHVPQTVEDLMEALTLTPHADKVSESYSGGNKRKLSLGVALIGNPKVLFIDEASSGMDPSARRKMWDLISEVSKSRSVVLTTHVMEEAEALCTRVGIMVSGKLRCLGSIQHLKTTFLDGYTIDVNCDTRATSDVVDSVVDTILNMLPGSTLAERHGRYLRFDVLNVLNNSNGVNDETMPVGLGGIFGRLQSLKNDGSNMIEDYSISQCSLEQVFINLAKAKSSSSSLSVRE